MNWIKQFFSRRALYNDISEELRQHLEEKTAQLQREGLSRKEAEQGARRAFGNSTLLEQRSREVWQWPTLESLWADLKYALRQLRKSPGFATVAILSLALGIGATTSMFSLIYAVLLHPVPYADWQRLAYPIMFNDDQAASREWWFILTWPQYQLLAKTNSVQDAVGTDDTLSELTGHDIPENVTLSYVTENIGNFLRVPALLGRNIQLSDAAAANQQAPVVLSYDFWMRHYDGDRDVLDKVLEIDHKPYTIVGVMPKNYTWEPDLYVPMSLLPVSDRRFIIPCMKLKPGVSLAMADAEIGALLHQFAKQSPREWPNKFRTHLEHISDRIIEHGGQALALLAAAVLMLLLIGCANCSVLLLARGMARQSELAVRSALGASRYRIVRQLLIEALVLAIIGSLLGILLAYWMAKLIFGLFPDVFMHESVIRINLPVLAFSVALAVISGLLFGLLPSLRMSRLDVSQMIQTTGRKVAGRVGQARSLNTIIAAQIALTVVMMGSAAAAIGGFMRMTHRNLGYDPSHVMSVPVPLHRNAYLTRESRAAYFESLRQKIATVPGVTQVAISSNAPPPDSGSNLAFEILGAPVADQQMLRVHFLDPQYFSTLHIPLLEGRFWDQSESSRAAAVAVINQTLARRYFPNSNPIGRQIRLPRLDPPHDDTGLLVSVPDSTGWMQIIGVVADSLNDGLDKPVQSALYMPYSRFMWMGTEFLVRTQGPPLAALHSVQLAIQSVNPDQQTERDVLDLQHWIEQQPKYQQQRLFSILFALFSGLALALALVGLYSVVSYSVAQRTNEFGIRMALGAQRSHVLWIVGSNVGITVSLGLVAGFAIFLALHQLLIHWTQNSDANLLILAPVAILFLFAAALASAIPARRASSIDPMQALRSE
ncbi:MAG TPA: ABC transporter permease [Silvibacterium sp.]|nr:ABC transporter permease [Silvibacterium sp.]